MCEDGVRLEVVVQLGSAAERDRVGSETERTVEDGQVVGGVDAGLAERVSARRKKFWFF